VTRKDFELIASAIMKLRTDCPSIDHDTLDDVSDYLAEAIAKAHPRFDTARFKYATGVWQKSVVDGVTQLRSGSHRVW
jgi:hypothetical protein